MTMSCRYKEFKHYNQRKKMCQRLVARALGIPVGTVQRQVVIKTLYISSSLAVSHMQPTNACVNTAKGLDFTQPSLPNPAQIKGIV